jgi:hypothetical protein
MPEDEDAAAASPDVKTLMSLDLKVPPPERLEPEERDALVETSILRIREAAGDVVTGDGQSGIELWMLLIVRMVTRGATSGSIYGKGKGKAKAEDAEGGDEEMSVVLDEQQDRLRTALFKYIMTDFTRRLRDTPNLSAFFANKRT